MKLFVPRETHPGETRVALVPELADRLVKLGASVEIESKLGKPVHLKDKDYEAVGVTISADPAASLASADMVLRLRKPGVEEAGQMKQGALLVSTLEPFDSADLIKALAEAGVTALCMELSPRTTIAQKMDVLSSQASLAGYVAVVLAAERLDKIMPMMMTPSGTLNPARVFIIGAGVAGLQAIATAKRLGARVEAFDTRTVVEEQVQSLGAKFVKVDLGETGQTKDGYAKALTDEQLAIQRDAMAKHCAQADVVITTAQVFGRKAPLIITQDMVKGMKPGSVVIDLAAETGGNVECTKPGKEVSVNGVRVIGLANLPGHVAVHASQMYASNLVNLVEHFWNKETNTFELNRDDEIIQGCLVTDDGAICHEMIRTAIEGEERS